MSGTDAGQQGLSAVAEQIGGPPAAQGWQQAVPALAAWTERLERGMLTPAQDLAARERALAKVSAAVMRGDAGAMQAALAGALQPQTGLSPQELSEAIFHMAFYAGFPRARQAGAALAQLAGPAFAGPPAAAGLMAVDEAAEARRDAGLREAWGGLAPAVVARTEDLFRQVWPRQGLAKKDRALLTVTALIAGSYLPQLAFHAQRGRDAGLSAREIGGVLEELLFLCGWPPVFQALPVLKEVYGPDF